MPIISSEPVRQKEKVKLELDQEMIKQIKEYMQWADIKDLSFFFQEAASFVLSKDKEWKQYQKKQKTSPAETA